MNQFFFVGKPQLAQNSRQLVGDGFAGGMKPDVLTERILQNAAFGIGQRTEQERTDEMRLRSNALRGFNQQGTSEEKLLL